jgi:hypothetical protein
MVNERFNRFIERNAQPMLCGHGRLMPAAFYKILGIIGRITTSEMHMQAGLA